MKTTRTILTVLSVVASTIGTCVCFVAVVSPPRVLRIKVASTTTTQQLVPVRPDTPNKSVLSLSSLLPNPLTMLRSSRSQQEDNNSKPPILNQTDVDDLKAACAKIIDEAVSEGIVDLGSLRDKWQREILAGSKPLKRAMALNGRRESKIFNQKVDFLVGDFLNQTLASRERTHYLAWEADETTKKKNRAKEQKKKPKKSESWAKTNDQWDKEWDDW